MYITIRQNLSFKRLLLKSMFTPILLFVFLNEFISASFLEPFQGKGRHFSEHLSDTIMLHSYIVSLNCCLLYIMKNAMVGGIWKHNVNIKNVYLIMKYISFFLIRRYLPFLSVFFMPFVVMSGNLSFIFDRPIIY